MTYQFDVVPSRRIPQVSNRWTMHPSDMISMWLADMDFPVAPQIQAALQKQMRQGVLGYELPDNALYTLIAGRMKKLYGWDVDPEWITYTAGVNHGYNVAARILCSRRKGYLIQTPVYNEFHDLERFTGFGKSVVRLEKKVSGSQIRYDVDFEAFERGVKKSQMFLLCHPHNPIGKIYSSSELKRMAEICIANGTIIVSDEIHSELLLGGAQFTPLAKLSSEIEKHTITLTSASKAFNVPGLACAFAVIPDQVLREKFRASANGMGIEVSTPGLTAARVAYSSKADGWLKALRRYLTDNRDFALAYIERHLPGVRATRPDATYLMWLDFSEYQLQPSPHEFLRDHARVVLSAGEKFGVGEGSFIRLNFGTSRRILKAGLDRIRKALK
jgi:cystathionine beta-lyase